MAVYIRVYMQSKRRGKRQCSKLRRLAGWLEKNCLRRDADSGCYRVCLRVVLVYLVGAKILHATQRAGMGQSRLLQQTELLQQNLLVSMLVLIVTGLGLGCPPGKLSKQSCCR